VFLSSHVLNEVEQVADWIGIINQGHLLFQGRLGELPGYQAPLQVATDRLSDASAVLKAKGWQLLEESHNTIAVEVCGDEDIAAVNRCLLEKGFQVYRLGRRQQTLEDLFLRLVSGHGQGIA
jgi:ABC-type multidrug transport system ATPase subunit